MKEVFLEKKGILPGLEADKRVVGALLKRNRSMILGFRDFQRGRGEYESKTGLTFQVLVSGIVDRCKNKSRQMLGKGQNIISDDDKFLEREKGEVEKVKELMIRFEEKEAVESEVVQKRLIAFHESIRSGDKIPKTVPRQDLKQIEDRITGLNESLKSGDAIRILESTVALENYTRGVFDAYEQLFVPNSVHERNSGEGLSASAIGDFNTAARLKVGES